jgi:hypothetical protein
VLSDFTSIFFSMLKINATATVGGGSAAAVTPTSNAQLVSYLSDSTARVIVLTKIFDFTSYCMSGLPTSIPLATER